MQIKFLLIFLLFALLGCRSGQSKKYSIESNSEFAKDSSFLTQIMLDYKSGEKNFKKNCNACHRAPNSNNTDILNFSTLFERLPPPPEQYFLKFVKDSKLLKLSGDNYANQLEKFSWNNGYEHSFKDSFSFRAFATACVAEATCNFW